MSKIYNKKLKIIQTDSKIKYDVITLIAHITTDLAHVLRFKPIT